MLGYKYRIYPSKEQQTRLILQMQLSTELHNYLLDYCTSKYKKAKEAGTTFSPTVFTIINQVSKFKSENPAYTEFYSHSFQDIGKRLGKSYSNFFRRIKEGKTGKKAGFPRFKKKVYSLTFPDAYGAGYKFQSDKRLYLSKIGNLPIKLDRAPKGNIKTLCISKDGNRWFASFSTDYEKNMEGIKANRTSIGLDLGLESFATLSDGQKIDNPRFYKTALKRIKLLQRRHSKKKKDSINRKKAGIKLWKAHQRVQDMRSDFLHKITTVLVRNHSLIAVEDLKINNMLHNHTLAGSIADAGWGTFKSYLAYKAESAGCQIVYVDPKNTTQTCSCCGQVLETKLSLSQRTFNCPLCNHSEDRDINAAKNILNRATAGRAGSQACEELSSTPRVLPLEQDAPMKQELDGRSKCSQALQMLPHGNPGL